MKNTTKYIIAVIVASYAMLLVAGVSYSRDELSIEVFTATGLLTTVIFQITLLEFRGYIFRRRAL